MVCVDDCFIPQNIMLPLSTGLHNGIHLFVISGILPNCFWKCLTMICHYMPLLSKDYPNSIVKGICLDLKWLLQVRKFEDWCRAEVMFQLYESLLLRFRQKYIFFCSSFGDLTQGPSGMREPQHQPAVEISKTHKAVELYQSGWGWPILNDLDLHWIHMHPPFINNVS